jgi:suppressor for copper-sensitivity B
MATTGASFRSPDVFVEGLKGAPGRPKVALAAAGRIATVRVSISNEAAAAVAGARLYTTIVDGARSAEMDITPVLGALPPITGDMTRSAILGLALLGGLILNLMPCVLPMLSLKLLALTGYAGAERRTACLGLLATAAGVMVSFGILAGVLILLKFAGAVVGWGIQFQQPWFLTGMALVTTLFAASLWGWASVRLPSGVADAVASISGRGRLTSEFLIGAFATIIAASCSAPFVGTAVGFALASGPLDITLVFGAMGLGMAAPFLAVAAAPGLIAVLPRPGPWMMWLERAFGLGLLGTAGWLLSVLAVGAGTGISLMAAGILVALLATLAWRQRLPPAHRARRLSAGAAVALAAVVVAMPLLRGQAGSVERIRLRVETREWQSFDETSLQRMVAAGKIVLVDVTAAWCLTCKANELTVLERPPVADTLHEPNVIAMRADWTRPDPVVTAYLQSFGRYGVPLDGRSSFASSPVPVVSHGSAPECVHHHRSREQLGERNSLGRARAVDDNGASCPA